MADQLHITDGTTTIDFDDPASAYHILWGGWAPNVGRVKHGGLGNTSHITDVVETMEISITGATSAAILTSLDTLVGLIEQAGRWARGSKDTAVEIQYEPTDSTTTLESYILGAVDNGPVVEHPDHFDAIQDGLILQPVTLRFRRQGMWRATGEFKSDLNVAQETIASITFTDDFNIPAPYILKLDDLGATAAPMNDAIVLLSEGGTGHIAYIEGESGTKISGDTWASTADSANDARGGSVGRATASAATSLEIEWDLSTDRITHRLAGIFAVVRNNVSARTWKLYAKSKTLYAHDNGRTYPTVVLDGADSTSPQVVFLGYILSPAAGSAHDKIQIVLEVDSISGSPTFDIDCVAVLGFDNPSNRAITLLPTSVVTNVVQVQIDPWSITKSPTNPIVWAALTSGEAYIAWRGDAYLTSTGTNMSGLLLTTRSAAWVWTNASDVPIAPDWFFTRTLAYLTPQ